jgi:hypothetical protein
MQGELRVHICSAYMQRVACLDRDLPRDAARGDAVSSRRRWRCCDLNFPADAFFSPRPYSHRTLLPTARSSPKRGSFPRDNGYMGLESGLMQADARQRPAIRIASLYFSGRR